MENLIIKGTGNSRSLKTVSDALQKYPTYPDFMRALISGKFPVDLLDLNPAGVQQMGTGYSKETVLPEPMAAKYGLDPKSATVAQVFSKLAEGGFAFRKAEQGTGNYPRKITFPFEPVFVFVEGWATGNKKALSFIGPGAGGTVTIAGKSGAVTNTPMVLTGDTITISRDPGGEIAGAHNVPGKYDLFVAFR